MNKVDFSIEFSHIYLNEIFSVEHEYSIKSARDVIASLPTSASYNLNVLIDDYNASEEVLDTAVLLRIFTKEAIRPDFLAFEANLAFYVEDILNCMQEGRLKRGYLRFIAKKKIPCSLMIVAWYFLRLGILEPKQEVLTYEAVGQNAKPFAGTHLITILPNRFEGVERLADKIIETTPYGYISKQIYRVYYDGMKPSVSAYVA